MAAQHACTEHNKRPQGGGLGNNPSPWSHPQSKQKGGVREQHSSPKIIKNTQPLTTPTWRPQQQSTSTQYPPNTADPPGVVKTNGHTQKTPMLTGGKTNIPCLAGAWRGRGEEKHCHSGKGGNGRGQKAYNDRTKNPRMMEVKYPLSLNKNCVGGEKKKETRGRKQGRNRENHSKPSGKTTHITKQQKGDRRVPNFHCERTPSQK